mmetsp:Transcript_11105/g.24492  ORF Transcript_11105/g.24492 Transcript_11105/m.24492 type:complete len:144 (+) Transcript_11105:999-1430(+)
MSYCMAKGDSAAQSAPAPAEVPQKFPGGGRMCSRPGGGLTQIGEGPKHGEKDEQPAKWEWVGEDEALVLGVPLEVRALIDSSMLVEAGDCSPGGGRHGGIPVTSPLVKASSSRKSPANLLLRGQKDKSVSKTLTGSKSGSQSS